MNVIDLFCGCGGLSYGYQEAGCNIILGIDNNETALKTFERNHLGSKGLNIDLLREDYRRIIKKCNTLTKQYTKIKTTTDKTLENLEQLEQNYEELRKENLHLNKYINYLKYYLDKAFEYTSLLFDFPKERLRKLVKDYLKGIRDNERTR